MRVRSARARERARRSEALKRGAIGVVLDGTRLLVLQRERVANPEFYPLLRSLGFKNLPDQSGMSAIRSAGICKFVNPGVPLLIELTSLYTRFLQRNEESKPIANAALIRSAKEPQKLQP